MDTITGSWLDTVDYSVDFPGEPLVQVGFPRKSPVQEALRIDDIDRLTPFYGDKQFGQYVHGGHEYGCYNGGAGQVVRMLRTAEQTLFEHGPTEAGRWVREAMGEPKVASQLFAPLTLREYVPRRWDSPTSSQAYWTSRGQVPNMVGLTPAAAALYLAAIGVSDRPVPLSFARGLLDPHFKFPDSLVKLISIKAEPQTHLHSLVADERHQLVIRSGLTFSDYLGKRYELGDNEPAVVVSRGWRARGASLFLGYPVEATVSEKSKGTPWPYEHDGARLVHLHHEPRSEAIKAAIPVIELTEIVPELAELFDEVCANPAELLDPSQRERAWSSKQEGASPVARRIVESALQEFIPWPYPFKLRTDADLRLRPRESADAVTALFDRLLDAPGPMRPTDLTAYFISLITKRRAEFAAWPEECLGVWGFKIKTGDHNWINGRIWHEPGETDNPSDPVEFEANAIRIESSRYRERHRHCVYLQTGSLRCYVERDDT